MSGSQRLQLETRANAAPAGSEAIARAGGSQQFPTHDSPVSHLRNALQILELAQRDDDPRQARRSLDPMGRFLDATAYVGLTTRIAAAIDTLEAERHAVGSPAGMPLLEEPRRVARELIAAIGRASAIDLRAALTVELQELATASRRDLRLAGDEPAELRDADREG